ncbi:hypothetical protein LZC95_15380 [Pendulispora brunnea]|uniref:Uncharacterized protein n=1 Tax=Pendulispora brunnea TaxID=2905690 RepID=A0ABZ2KPE9_9BACT
MGSSSGTIQPGNEDGLSLPPPPVEGPGRAVIEAHILAVLRQHRERIMSEVVDILSRSRLARVVREAGSGAQATTGLLRALEEQLEGRKTPTRVFWLETLFPSLMERGVTLVDIARVSTRIHIALVLLLVLELPPELRRAGGEWLGTFFSGLQADITRECRRSSEPPASGS